MDSANYNHPREKILIHTDKPVYRLSDTMWLKGYILTAAEHMPNDSSKIAYVEIIDGAGMVVKRINPPCAFGLFESYIALSGPDFSQGKYLLRSYTRHMRNFGDSLFFSLPFTVVNPADNIWKVTIRQLTLENNRFQLSAKLSAAQLSEVEKKPLTLRLRSRNKNLFKVTLMPTRGGEIVADTLLGSINSENLVMEISDGDNLRLSTQVIISRSDSVDLQFFPEGGSFIAGKEQRLGLKAINKKGKGVAVAGVIKDSQDVTVADFTSFRYGMGILKFTPLAGEVYTAVLNNGHVYPLPRAENSGVLLAVYNSPEQDSLVIRIRGSTDREGEWVYFTTTCRGMVLARGRIQLKDKPYEFKLNRNELPSGIIVCTVYNVQLQPINERCFFVWQNDGLQIALSTHKITYLKKDSVSLLVKVADKSGQPVTGSFSLSVVDTSQVPVVCNQENLLSYMLLASDLRGDVEEPSFYFSQPVSEETEALMLTQGWVSYRRSDYSLPYSYEKNFSISGRVVNVFNKPLTSTGITLFGRAGKGNAFLLDTLTTEKGTFTFDRFSLFETDSISLVFRALNRKGRAFNVGITLDEPGYPPYAGNALASLISEVQMDTIARKYMAVQDSLVEQMKKDGTYLKEVIIRGRATIPGSKNLNADGGADQVINGNTLEKTPKESLLDILQRQVKGFRTGVLPKGTLYRYMINSNMVRFIIDGVDLEYFYDYASANSTIDYLNYYKGHLEYFSAEDIKGIEIMNTPRHNSTYRTHFLNIQELLSSGPARIDYSFVEITTHSGSGPFMRKTPGMYLYKPVFPFISKQFYSPEYSSPDEATAFPDFRSTIYWNPNIITDDKGEVTLTFYTSESRSNYLMFIQGTDLKGRIGVQHAPLIVQ